MNARGLNLVEVVIALVLLGFALISISSLFAFGARALDGAGNTTVATGIAIDVMEQLRGLSFDGLYGSFGAAGTQSGVMADSLTNSYAGRWQSLISSRLFQGKATVTLTPIGPGTGPGPPPFDACRGIRVGVTIEWQEGSRSRSVSLQTVRF